MAKDIKLLRLVSGEEVLAEVIETNNETITVKNAVRIMVFPSKVDEKQPSVAFAPYTHWAKEPELTFKHIHVLTVNNPIPQFIEQYNATFSGLLVPEPKIILN